MTFADVYSGFEASVLASLDRETTIRKKIAELDLCFEFLGHLTRDGEVVGFVTESAKGRVVQYRDRSKAGCSSVTGASTHRS